MPSPAVISPNAFTGSDSERINQALRAAAGTGARVVVPRRNQSAAGERDLWLLDSAILVPGDTTLILDGCHLKLSDRCRDNLIRSANCGPDIPEIKVLRGISIIGEGQVLLGGADRPRATGDSAKTLGTQTYGTDAGVAGESQTGDWRNLGILLAFVEDFRLENLHLKDSHAWAISLERCAHGLLRDLSFDSRGYKEIDGVRRTILNQDGIDLRQGCHDITLDGIRGVTGDDLVALTAIVGRRRPDRPGALGSTMISAAMRREGGLDDIHTVFLRRLCGYSAGGHHVVRFLNAGGLRLHHIVVDGLIDTSPPDRPCKATLKIGDANPAWGGVTPLGDTGHLLVNQVTGASRHTILIAGSLIDSCFSNILSGGPATQPVTYESGPEHVRNVLFTNVVSASAPRP